MTDKPIPFTRAMAVATWRGDKTETRRVLKGDAPKCPPICYAMLPCGICSIDTRYAPSDHLWVREPYWQRGYWAPKVGATTKGGADKWQFLPEDWPRFDPPDTFRLGMRRDGTAGRVDWYQRLARFMPRQYSRQTLLVRTVRVERLHDIDDAGCHAEGIRASKLWGFGVECDGLIRFVGATPRHAFERIWAAVNGPKSWDANPWVIVVRYEKLGDV